MTRAVVFSEDLNGFKNAASLAYSIANEVYGVGYNDVKYTDKLYLIDRTEEDSIADFISSMDVDLYVFGNSKKDKIIAAQVAGKRKIGYIPDIISVEVSEGKKVIAERVAYSGLAISKLECELPCVVTVSKSFGEVKERNTQIERVNLKESKIKVIESKKATSSADLANAQIIVSVGRGLGSKDNVALAEELAKILGGAVGGSRPVVTELGWLPEDRQIGLSGIKVRPKLYIALGISGQPQHLVGIKDSKIIVAVNTDKNAPIVDNADYVIIGDAVEFLKTMIERLKAK